MCLHCGFSPAAQMFHSDIYTILMKVQTCEKLGRPHCGFFPAAQISFRHLYYINESKNLWRGGGKGGLIHFEAAHIFTIIYVLHSYVRNFLSNPRRIHSGRKRRRKRNMGCYELLSASCHPSPPLQLPPSPHRASVALPAATLSGLAGRERPLPPPPTHSPNRIVADSGSLGQNRGRPPFRSLWVL